MQETTPRSRTRNYKIRTPRGTWIVSDTLEHVGDLVKRLNDKHGKDGWRLNVVATPGEPVAAVAC